MWGVTENEVLECFWRAERSAHSRWTEADVVQRKRSWHAREDYFEHLPRDLAWERVALTAGEVLRILYIAWDWWSEITGGTRLPLDAAARHRTDELRALAERCTANPELIVVAEPDRSKLVVLEGHVRLSAYAAFPECLP